MWLFLGFVGGEELVVGEKGIITLEGDVVYVTAAMTDVIMWYNCKLHPTSLYYFQGSFWSHEHDWRVRSNTGQFNEESNGANQNVCYLLYQWVTYIIVIHVNIFLYYNLLMTNVIISFISIQQILNCSWSVFFPFLSINLLYVWA